MLRGGYFKVAKFIYEVGWGEGFALECVLSRNHVANHFSDDALSGVRDFSLRVGMQALVNWLIFQLQFPSLRHLGFLTRPAEELN
jgi:hypothetical protein